MIAHLEQSFSNNLYLAVGWCDFEHLHQEVNELLAEGIFEQVIFQHETMIVEPYLLIELMSVECINFLKWNDSFSIGISYDDIGLEFLLIQ